MSITLASPAADRHDFLDFDFQVADIAQVALTIGERPAAAPFTYVVTPNVDHVVRLFERRSDLWPVYRAAWMTLCDSRILGRLAAWSGMTLAIVPGSDLVATLFARIIRPDDRIAILGGSTRCIAKLRERYGLTDVVHLDPPMGFIDSPADTQRAIRFLVEANARYTILAVGSPQQEMVAYQMSRLGTAVGVGLCVGASLDFLTGAQTRAPRFMQQWSLEWLYRLASRPGRLAHRYLVDGPMILGIVRAWRHHRPA